MQDPGEMRNISKAKSTNSCTSRGFVTRARTYAQDLEHQSGILANDLQEARNSWINKALTSLRTSSGGLPNLSMSRDGSPALGWSLQSSKKLSWPHRDNL